MGTDKGSVRAAPVTFTVAEATVGDNRARLADIATARFIPPPVSVWQGQVFALGYALEVDKNYFYGLGSHPDWQPAPLIIEDWPQPDSTEIVQGGVRKVRINYRTLALAPTAGELALQPAKQLVNLNTGTTSFGFFGRPNLEQYGVSSAPATINVKPLPAPAPAGFSGIVGDFNLTAKAVPLDAQVGEPVTWTLTLEGVGNWPSINALPSREVSRDFRVVQPQAVRTPAREGGLFNATLSEDVVLIPTAPGTHTLGPVNLVVFDPAKGDYRTLATETFTINVTGAPIPAATTTPGPATTPAAGTQPPPPAPVKPVGVIPLDPLPDAPPAGNPLAPSPLLRLCAAPFALPPLLWFALALRRSRQTDPARHLREARDRLARTLDQIAEQPTPELVRAWRDDTARLWQLDVATPTPRDFPDAGWGALWAESERVLYRRDTPIAPQWIAQARQALALHAVPAWSPWQLFRPRNLFPWLATIALLLLLAPALPAQTDDYASGDFAAAETGWRERIQKTPTDWAARHNLSLALAQQDRWDEAAAHAAVAWLHNPASPATRW
ncbi:MAG: BatD family protein [Verrucomicrobiota bacterium]